MAPQTPDASMMYLSAWLSSTLLAQPRLCDMAAQAFDNHARLSGDVSQPESSLASSAMCLVAGANILVAVVTVDVGVIVFRGLVAVLCLVIAA